MTGLVNGPGGTVIHAREQSELARLDADARHHKREAERHRRMAREAREKQAALKAECARRGIAVREA